MTTKDVKRREAKERQAIYDGMTVEQKLQRATKRPGASAKEVARLTKLLEKKKEVIA